MNKKKIEKYFYEDTGLYIDWDQLKKLPEIDTLIDIGVGTNGTPDLYERFPNQKLVLIDPLEESHQYIRNNLKHRNTLSFKTALGREKKSLIMNVEEKAWDRSSFLEITFLLEEVVETRTTFHLMIKQILQTRDKSM